MIQRLFKPSLGLVFAELEPANAARLSNLRVVARFYISGWGHGLIDGRALVLVLIFHVVALLLLG